MSLPVSTEEPVSTEALEECRGEYNTDVLMTYKEAAAFLRMPVGTLSSLVCRRRIPHVRLGPRTVRFERHVLETWMEAHRVDSEEE